MSLSFPESFYDGDDELLKKHFFLEQKLVDFAKQLLINNKLTPQDYPLFLSQATIFFEIELGDKDLVDDGDLFPYIQKIKGKNVIRTEVLLLLLDYLDVQKEYKDRILRGWDMETD